MRFVYIIILVVLLLGCIQQSEPSIGCQFNNPSCNTNENCINNYCILKSGCQYNNPICDDEHACINNLCTLKSGCQYGNPPCTSGYDCHTNRCIPVPLNISNNITPNNQQEICGFPINITVVDDVINGADYIVFSEVGSDLRVVCQKPCQLSDNLLKKKYVGLKKSILSLKSIVGLEFTSQIRPIDFHFTSDSACGNFEDFSIGTGFAGIDGNGHGIACTFDYEKTNIIVPLTEENACRTAGQLLSVHEAGHLILPIQSYTPSEHFVKMLSFHISGYWDGNDASKESSFLFNISACDDRMKSFAPLSYELCRLYGIDVNQYDEIFAQATGEMSNNDLKNAVDTIAGKDTSQAFQNANIILT
ncbi:MAG: hypothetical protein ABID61_02510 [Candidatus Micrarchaeota archaeon]